MSTTPADADVKTERAVLGFVLSLHPTRLSRGELARALADDPEDFADRDAICRAVDELVAAGLLHRDGQFVAPTRAALRFDCLMTL
jgi:hypothetical protein